MEDIVLSLREDNKVLESILSKASVGIEGGSSPDKRLYLMSLIFSCNAKLVYEIGFNSGCMAAAMARGLEHTGGKYVGFDIKKDLVVAFDFLDSKYKCPMEAIWGDSTTTLPSRTAITGECPDIIFVDGGHTPEVLSADIRNSLACVKVGGYIVIDDALDSSLRPTIIDILGEDKIHWVYGFHPLDTGLAVYQVKGQ